MTYSDTLLRKDSSGVKVRLDSYDLERVEYVAEKTGMPIAVVMRNLVIDALDAMQVQYRVPKGHVKQIEYEQRQHSQAVANRIKQAAAQIEANRAVKAASNEKQETLFRTQEQGR